MKDPRIVNAFDSLEPSDETKKRMLDGIMAQTQTQTAAGGEGTVEKAQPRPAVIRYDGAHTRTNDAGVSVPPYAKPKRRKRTIAYVAAAAACLVLIAGISMPLLGSFGMKAQMADSAEMEVAMDGGAEAPMSTAKAEPEDFNTEEYNAIDEHGFTSTASQPFSTFAADVDTASYANWRRMVTQGYVLGEFPDGALRVEEFLNYFDYDYAGPQGDDLFGVTATISDCPWNPDTKLLVMGLQTAEVPYDQAADGNNLVFLIDVSGSMDDPSKLGLLKDSFTYLVENLNPTDTVSIVTYSGEERVVLEGEPAENKRSILRAVDSLEAGGSTNGEAGLAMAYKIANEYYLEGGNNRIILASDGDLNVGMTSESELSDFVSQQRESGIYLSVLGFGDGNYKDNKMETLANDGNGNYHYIDCLAEAQKVLGEDLCSTMVTVADDVKLQLEFNPAYVKGYRQIGYENRELSADEFLDDRVDAGEVGAGHSITVAYELVMVDSAMELFESESRYGSDQLGVENGEWFALDMRWKKPGGDVVQEASHTFGEGDYTTEPSDDWTFAAAVIEYCMIATDSQNKGDSSIMEVLEMVDSVLENGADDYRREFRQLVSESTE